MCAEKGWSAARKALSRVLLRERPITMLDKPEIDGQDRTGIASEMDGWVDDG